MSHSYKKTFGMVTIKGKGIANHTVRQWLKRNMSQKLAPGDYKKLYKTWNICDYGWTCIWENEWKKYCWTCSMFPSHHHKEPDKKECYRKWLKFYHHK